MYQPNVDALIISGSRAKVRARRCLRVSEMRVTLPNLATRSLLDRLLERPSVVDYGVDMTGMADSTVAFAAAVNTTGPFTRALRNDRVTGYDQGHPQRLFRFTGAGDCTFIKYDAPAGTPAKPLIDIHLQQRAPISLVFLRPPGLKYSTSKQYDGLAGGVSSYDQADHARASTT